MCCSGVAPCLSTIIYVGLYEQAYWHSGQHLLRR